MPNLGPVHDVRHPHLAGVPEGEAAAVGAVMRRDLVEQPVAGEKPVYGPEPVNDFETVTIAIY